MSSTSMRIRVAAMALTLLCLLITSGSDWVDYPSGMRCCSYIEVDRCDPQSPTANRACRDVCHYGGCGKGGQCEDLGDGVRACHCNC